MDGSQLNIYNVHVLKHLKHDPHSRFVQPVQIVSLLSFILMSSAATAVCTKFHHSSLVKKY